MEQLCLHHNDCCFFSKYGHRKSRMWKNLVALYCRGGLMSRCWWHQRYAEGDRHLQGEVMPNGEKIPEPIEMLP